MELGRIAVKRRQPAQIDVVGRELARLHLGALDLGDLDLWGDRTDHARRDLVLQRKDLGQCALEAIGPQMHPVQRIDELAGDAHSIARPADAPFEDIPHAQLAADLAHVG